MSFTPQPPNWGAFKISLILAPPWGDGGKIISSKVKHVFSSTNAEIERRQLELPEQMQQILAYVHLR